jgi:crotonobetainyl-CoA:carnitine CoA-transferase CaiB-like acyl-CoA transferase
MPRPLDNIRVLDLGRIFAAPWATQMLADLGAEIIKIERPEGGDSFRVTGPPYLEPASGAEPQSYFFVSCNRSKQSVTVNLAAPEGQDLIRRLAAQCDVLVENYKVGDLARYGLDYDSIRKINPRIVYASLTGFGQTGPYRHRPGYDTLFQGASGLMSVTGEPEGHPQKVGFVIADFVAGMYAAIGILAALRHRDATGGLGQHIDVGMLDTMFAALSHQVQAYLISGEVPQRVGNVAAAQSGPVGLYACADGGLAISAGKDPLFLRLCAAIGRPELAQESRFLTPALRYQHRQALDEILKPIFRSKTTEAWSDTLLAAGVICTPVSDIAQAAANPQIKARGMVVELNDALRLVANPLHFSATPITEYQPPPALGEHTESVLGRLLGLDADAIGALRERGAI